jgi:glutamate/aspartate transport system permease protein
MIFWVYFLGPYVLARIAYSDTPVQISAVTSAFVTFSLFEACYYCEIVRAGIALSHASKPLRHAHWDSPRFRCCCPWSCHRRSDPLHPF